MLRSMYSGISGMKVNQTKLDVTGNNIANVGTTAFKGSRVRFQDMLSQNMSEALGPGRNTGGVNARQVGLGVQVAGIDTVVTQGMMQPTSRNLDVAVDGTGYFLVAKGALPATNAGGVAVEPSSHTMSGSNFQMSYTRDGAFTLDYQGNLLTSDGYRVMGYALQEKSGTNTSTLSIDYDANGFVNFVDSDSKDGLVTTGSVVPLRIPDSVHVNPLNIVTGIDMEYTGSGDKSVFDTDTAIDGIQGYPTIRTIGAYKGTEDARIEIKWANTPDDPADPTAGSSFKWSLYRNGTYIGEAVDGEFDIDGDTVNDIEITAPDDTTLTGLTPTPTDADIAKYSWSTSLTAEKDKKIRSFSIEKDGVIKAVLDDGSVSALGQIGMASFKNPEGLKKLGKNLYQNTSNSGQPIIKSGVGADKANDNSDGYGEMLQGMLEMSNIDLAEQFTDMIVTTRAFQAAGKMITTGDEILQEIINLKR